ncbi:54S ribosomal protein L23, mitochondrial [Schistosoma haematobium]|uniref:Large ribosomal subunit protein uL23m n=1 Tax=Schistosoma haematobium TaxID=6185 RepID=A0A922IKQ6_SCHHA|nr:54S ribosomal protein L23, mitochondrial [Schistosoma haematobium]KAH9581736.1 54S ribosomal protein L23, mitochondrial [Schistosoma haematobium]CAH8614391.1 unnamed protein product [Schistosoma haematobium]CAH8622034.1 unnamed protein product [Schistosoma haematobium]CAH8818807.1 unnamed protein product [Schistosoma curassoni]
MLFSKSTHSNYLVISYLRMTKRDVQQYLEKIYNVPVVDVRVKMVHHDLEPVDVPPLRKAQRSLDSTQFPPKPERYEKVAYVRLAPGEVFVFPDLFKDKRPSEATDTLMDGVADKSEEVVSDVSKKVENNKLQPLKGCSKWFAP